ncbi:response regulator [endosymbiont 'TC1' of Trimyema compressum]|uniref:response regulator n=1 Tax=endosymbiont 'TC1' of Trimyema compressum TaxID=243899 RepID=UPI003CCBAE3B
MLGDYSGLELCKIIRDDEETKHIPIIMITAKTTEFDTIVGLESGANDYLKKPFSINELIARVRALLRQFAPKTEVPKSSLF